MYLRLSKLRYVAQLEQIKDSPERNLTGEQVGLLADCSWVKRAENILITGAYRKGQKFPDLCSGLPGLPTRLQDDLSEHEPVY